MPATLQHSTAGQIHDHLRGAARFQVSGLIGEADDGVCVGDVDVLRRLAGRIECDSEGLVEAGGKRAGGFCAAIRTKPAQDRDFAGAAFGDE